MSKVNDVLIVGAGMLQVPLIREAQALGLYVIATDGNLQAHGATIADEFQHIDTYDIKKHAYLARELSTVHGDPYGVTVLGCCTAGADVAPTVAVVCKVLGTPGIPLAVARRTHNKIFVRQKLSEQGQYDNYQPTWCVLDGYDDRRIFRELNKYDLAYPLVIKPATQRASRGISIVSNVREFWRAVGKARQYGDDILIEQCLTGTEHSAEAILDGHGGLLWFNIVDRPFTYEGGRAIELGHVNPSSLVPAQQHAIKTMLLDTAQTLGVTWGPFKADVMWTEDGPKILEVTARLSGGWDCQGTSPLTGRHPIRTLLQLACGLPVEIWHEAQGYAACAAILPESSGVIRELPAGLELNPAQLLGQVHQVIWAIQPGATLAPVEHNAQRAGFVLASAPTYTYAWHLAKTAADALASAVKVV